MSDVRGVLLRRAGRDDIVDDMDGRFAWRCPSVSSTHRSRLCWMRPTP